MELSEIVLQALVGLVLSVIGAVILVAVTTLTWWPAFGITSLAVFSGVIVITNVDFD